MTEILLALKADTDTITQGWTAYTPGAVTSGSGAITTASATGRFSQPVVTQTDGSGVKAGKLVSFRLDISISNAGTGAGTLTVANALPVIPQSAIHFTGVRSDNSKAVVAVGTGRQLVITLFDGTTAIATGAAITITGSYEAA
jgi:hypothetical protein